MESLDIDRPQELVSQAQAAIGPEYQVTADIDLLNAEEDEERGGRTDDDARAADITQALTSDDIAAIIAVRGGAWFTRTLPRIDFTALDRRSRPLAVFGFSELTPLVNIVGAHARGLGVYDMGPAFLTYGLRLHAGRQQKNDATASEPPHRWMRRHLRPAVDQYYQRVVAMIEGRDSTEPIMARLIRGPAPKDADAIFLGGNLTVLSTMIGSRYERCISPQGKWLVLEDFNDKPERFDRFLSHLTLAGYWEQCTGVLLGDFHQNDRDLTSALAAMLHYHLPQGSELPVLFSDRIGHTWPMSPLPLQRPLKLRRRDENLFEISWAPSLLRVV